MPSKVVVEAAAAAAAVATTKRVKLQPGESIARFAAPRKQQMNNPQHSTVRILSWNVNGLQSVINKHKADFMATIADQKPDLVFLQETKLQTSNAEKLVKEFAGFTAHYSCSTAKKGYSGTAVLVRDGFHVKSIKMGFEGEDKLLVGHDEGRAITVELDSLYFVGMYVVNSGEGLVRLRDRVDGWDAAVRRYVKKLETIKPVVIGGDLNVAHKDIDVWNFDAPHIKKQAGCTSEERASFSRLLEENDMADTFRELHPLATGWFTYWSVRASNRAPNKGLRLDYFVVSRALMRDDDVVVPRLCDSWIVADCAPGISDHGPIVCELVVNKQE
jgi:exodeoxyribonuclease-3